MQHLVLRVVSKKGTVCCDARFGMETIEPPSARLLSLECCRAERCMSIEIFFCIFDFGVQSIFDFVNTAVQSK